MSKTRKFTTAGIAALIFAVAAAAADAKDKVKVGFISPLTGGVSVNGLGGRNSADLAVRLRNADPKSKYEYELVVLDDECKPNVAVQVATKMAADKDVIAGATHYCSATAIATVDVYHKFGFPVIVWGAVLPDITYRNKYDEVHRVNGTMINQNDANAELISRLGYKTVAVIHDTTDYGKGHLEYFSKALDRIGKTKIVGTFGVTADQQDFTSELTKIKALNPDVIYFGGLTPIGVRIRSQMDKLGIKAVFDGTSVSCPMPISRASARWQKARSPSAKARQPRSCRAASSSWKNTTRRNTTIRQRPTAPSLTRPWT